MNYRIRVVVDDDADYSYLPSTEEEYLRDGPYLDDGRAIPFDEYLRTYGDVDNYVSFGVIAEKQCACCGKWDSGTGFTDCWGIDYYLYGPYSSEPIPIPGTYSSLDDLKDFPRIYEIAAECVAELEEAGESSMSNLLATRNFEYRGFPCSIEVYPNLSSYTIYWPDYDVLKRGKIIADSSDEVDAEVRYEINNLRDWWVRKQKE